MTPEELVSRGGIYFDKIQNGMAEYEWESTFLSPRMADKYLRELWKKNGEGYSFVDCYYPFLEQESKERILSVLNQEQQEYLKQLDEKKEDLLLPLDEQLLSIAITLNDKEMLFFSFYFLKEPCTIWGNYKQEYLIFHPTAERKEHQDSGQIKEKNTGNKEREENHTMRIFSHRGFSGKYPENTMLAFQKAWEVGCDGIELDVQLTRDDVIVIMHDETIDRTTNGTGNIRDYTYEQLCAFDCRGQFEGKYDFQRIPTLQEYLEWVKGTNLITNIELKNSVYYYENLEEKVIDMVRRYHLEDRILFSTFNLVSAVKCKKLIPEIPVGFLMETQMDNIASLAHENEIEFYHPGMEVLTKEEIRKCHEKGIGVNVWTVNKKKHMKQMAEWEVDGIFTNYPDKAKKLKSQGII